jgi:hypothetical protein
MNWQNIIFFLKNNKKFVLVVSIPLLASLLPLLVQNKQANCGFVLIVMALYWTTGLKKLI